MEHLQEKQGKGTYTHLQDSTIMFISEFFQTFKVEYFF